MVGVLIAAAALLTPDSLADLLRGGAARLGARQATPSALVPLVLAGVGVVRLALLAVAALYVVTVIYWRRVQNEVTAQDTEPARVLTRGDVWALLTLVAIAAALRVWSMTSSFWWDELDTMVRLVRRGIPAIVLFSAGANNHVLNSLLALGASKVLGEAEWAVRFPGFLIGVLTPPAAYWLARRVLPGPAAFALGFLFAVHFRCVVSSDQVRGYAGALLFSIIACFLFDSMWGSFRRSVAVAYVLSTTAAIGFQYLSIFVPIAHAIAAGAATLYALRSGARGRPFPLRFALLLTSAWGALAGFMIYAAQLPQLMQFAHGASDLMRMSWTLLSGIVRYSTGGSTVVVSCLVVLCAVYGWTRRRKDAGLPISFLFPGALMLMAFALTGTPGSPRLFWILILPVLMGLVLFVYDSLQGGKVLTKAVAVAVLILLMADSVPLYLRYYTLGTPALRQVGAWVGSRPIWLVGPQSDLNRYYFPKAVSFGWEDEAVAGAGATRAPDLILASVDCTDLGKPVSFEAAGFRRIRELTDWTVLELWPDWRPCYVLLQR